jgi:radical SAM enzyme (TIGR01210 family)
VNQRVGFGYPGDSSARTEFVLARRGKKTALDPERAYGAFVEEEPDGEGGTVRVATVLLTNRECPWRCVFCDLWRNTLDATVPFGAIRGQIDRALAELPPARWIKLYNAGSFFDPRAIPPGDLASIAESVAGFERVIVESHPKLVGDETLRFRDLLTGRLEVAMGLEAADASVLAKLHKGMTLEDFVHASWLLRREAIGIRAFVLVQPPFVGPEFAVGEAVHAAAFAEKAGADVVALLPTRGGNGALEALAGEGDFAPPKLATLEDAFDASLGGSLRVLADTWDLDAFADCRDCFAARRDRLARMNLSQKAEPRVACPACAASSNPCTTSRSSDPDSAGR